MVSDSEKSCRKLTSWSRQKIRRDWRNRLKVDEIPFRRAPQIILPNDTGYRADLDIIHAGRQPMPAELSTDDEDKATGIWANRPTKRGARGKASETQKLNADWR